MTGQAVPAIKTLQVRSYRVIAPEEKCLVERRWSKCTGSRSKRFIS
jgi:hypothetical protein